MTTTDPQTGYASVNGLDMYPKRRPEAYAREAPNPEAWPTLVAKVMELNRQIPEWPSD
jgi:hypothetical protein